MRSKKKKKYKTKKEKKKHQKNKNKTQGWTKVPLKSKKFICLIWHPPCYSCSQVRKNIVYFLNVCLHSFHLHSNLMYSPPCFIQWAEFGHYFNTTLTPLWAPLEETIYYHPFATFPEYLVSITTINEINFICKVILH